MNATPRTANNPVAQALTRHDGNAHHYDYSSESPHFVEQALTVYLRLSDDGTRWIVDSATMDGHSLDSAHSDLSAHNSECACGRREECDSVLAAADKLSLPTGRELIALLIDALP
jgi:hypothetical protein